MEFSLHPGVYATNPHLPGLRQLLEDTWIHSHRPGDGTLYLISGFGNYNGGARFYKTFKEHTEAGGSIVAIFAGSNRQRLTSKELVTALLECGAEVHVVNRKRLLHAKCYGKDTTTGQNLLVSSGNFTGPGMSSNGEATVRLHGPEVTGMGFDWHTCIAQLLGQTWQIQQPLLADLAHPAWQLLYGERSEGLADEEVEQLDTTLIVWLNHSDTARIQAVRGTKAGRGSQYFWVSKDSFDFFPPLTIQNQRGIKGTLSALVTMHYPQSSLTDTECRITFEAENNLDFRVGTGPLRYTKLATQGDLACISRVGASEYVMHIIPQGTPTYDLLEVYATTFIGHAGKRYGYIENTTFTRLASVTLS